MRSFNEYKGIEILGQSVFGLVQAFGQFKALASQLLLAEGIGRSGPDGQVVVDLDAWYPMDGYLRAFARANQQMSGSVLHQIGVSVAKYVEEAGPLKDIQTLAKILDKGYHMHHRKHGRPMWDPTTGILLEGIGHYQCRNRSDGSVEIESDIPYPCAFDKGLLFGFLRRTHTVGAILHDDSHPCRERGNRSCVYIVKG